MSGPTVAAGFVAALLIAAGIRATGDTALLLRHTLESRLETMSVVGQIVRSSASLPHFGIFTRTCGGRSFRDGAAS